MREELRICISSPPDREKLVAEIFIGDQQWAELNQEHGTLSVQFYPRRDGQFWELSLDVVSRALSEAKRRLTGT
jgi:hypothetical protein